MRRLLAQTITAFLTLLPLAGHAAGETGAYAPQVSEVPTSAWPAVGRIDFPGGAYCTGTLIAADIVLTAAHCLYDPATGIRVSPSRIEFLAGLTDGRAAASRGVRAAVTHPGFSFTAGDRIDRVAHDLSLLQLDTPISQAEAAPFGIKDRPRRGATVGVVSYGNSHAGTPGLQPACEVLARQGGALVLSCASTPGASGSPVFVTEDGTPRIVSVISAMASVGARAVSLGTALTGPLEELRAQLLAQNRTALVLEPGEPTGAPVFLSGN